MDRQTYDQYLAKFNVKDYEAILDYWIDDNPELIHYRANTNIPVICSKNEIRDLYKFLHCYIKEEIIVKKFVSDDDMIAMEAIVKITGLKDLTTDLLEQAGLNGFFPIKAGDVFEIPQFIHYHLKGGKIQRALCSVLI